MTLVEVLKDAGNIDKNDLNEIFTESDLNETFTQDEQGKVKESISSYELQNKLYDLYPEKFLEALSDSNTEQNSKLTIVRNLIQNEAMNNVLICLRRFWISKILFEIRNEKLSFDIETTNFEYELELLFTSYKDKNNITIQEITSYFYNVDNSTTFIFENIQNIYNENKKSITPHTKEDLLLSILSLNQHRKELSISEIYCLTGAGNKVGFVYVASLEIINQEGNDINVFLVDKHERFPCDEIKTSFQNTLKIINEEDNDIFKGKSFVITFYSIIPQKKDNISITGRSFNLPISLLLKQVYIKRHLIREMGISATGNLEGDQVEGVTEIESKIKAIKMYNDIYTFNTIKLLYVPEANENECKKSILNASIKYEDNYSEVIYKDQLTLTVTKNININPFALYLNNKSETYNNISEENFENEYLSLKGEENLFFPNDGKDKANLIDKNGVIIPCFPTSDKGPKDIAGFICSYLCKINLKNLFDKQSIPILIDLSNQDTSFDSIVNKIQSEVNDEKIERNYLIQSLINKNSFVFIAYSEPASKTSNIINVKHIEFLKLLKKNHYLVAVSNSLEQANYWDSLL